MSLQKKIENELNQALKKNDKNTFPTLRLVIAAIKDAMIAKKVRDASLSDADITSILKKMVKQRNDSCEAYENAGRTELLENEKKEIEIIKKYLPKELTDEETKKICIEEIKNLKAQSIRDMGKVIGSIKSKHADALDFGKVSKLVKELLNK